MKIKSVKNLTFQRNGVHGESFYHCFATTNEAKGEFIVTFQTEIRPNGGGTQKDYVIIPTCRAVSINEPTEIWRGDEFAWALNDYFKAIGLTDIYRATTSQKQANEVLTTK